MEARLARIPTAADLHPTARRNAASPKRSRVCVSATMLAPRENPQEQDRDGAATRPSLRKQATPLLASRRNDDDDDSSLHNNVSVQDYMEQSAEMIRAVDGGPPRWFCPLECGQPAQENAPVLLFLPGLEGTGLGLLLHHRTLGALFEVRCLHIPALDRTSFEGLIRIVEDAVKAEKLRRPSSPVYLVGNSFGGTLALAVAARNPSADLVLVLANPATSIERSQLLPLFPIVELVPDEAFQLFPFLFGFTLGDPLRMAAAKVTAKDALNASRELSDALTSLLPTLPNLSRILPKDTLMWRLKLLKEGASYANSRLHAVQAQVLVLASAKDQLLPSLEEGKRLKGVLKRCLLRVFKDSGHTLLLEDGSRLATMIKSTLLYRRSSKRNYVTDYVPPTMDEFRSNFESISTKVVRQLVSPVFLSTNEQGEVVKGLGGLPDEGPLIFVGNHMLMGIELSLFVGELFKERKEMVRGLAHPSLFTPKMHAAVDGYEGLSTWMDQVALFGGVPVSGRNFYDLLSNKESVLLYPGGAREALHRKGEDYKLFWPERCEFVRMAGVFGATIVPFSCVGEDDLFELLLDYDDLSKNSFLREKLVFASSTELRSGFKGEVANQPMYFPVMAPKFPGRFYILCRKPIPTAGRSEELKDRSKAYELYAEVKAEVEAGISYMLKKREQDPYRSALPRLLYEATWGGTRQSPSFDVLS